MSPAIAFAAIVALLAVATVAGALLARRGARIRAVDGAELDGVDFRSGELGGDLGSAGTVIQFSTAYCSRCPATRRMIAEAVEPLPGVEFIHVDVTDRPELAARYRLAQTPTVLILDRAGAPRTRLSGPLSRAALAEELATTIGHRP